MEFYGLIQAPRISAQGKLEGLIMASDVEERQRREDEVEGRMKRATMAGPLRERNPMEGAWRTTRGKRKKGGWLEYKG